MEDPKYGFWGAIPTVCVVIPLALQRETSALRYACLAGFFFVCYMVGVIIVQAFILVKDFEH